MIYVYIRIRIHISPVSSILICMILGVLVGYGGKTVNSWLQGIVSGSWNYFLWIDITFLLPMLTLSWQVSPSYTVLYILLQIDSCCCQFTTWLNLVLQTTLEIPPRASSPNHLSSWKLRLGCSDYRMKMGQVLALIFKNIFSCFQKSTYSFKTFWKYKQRKWKSLLILPPRDHLC